MRPRNRCWWHISIGLIVAFLVACGKSEIAPRREGDLAKEGGSPTIRRSFQRALDDPDTTNDESNDQPVGHFGTLTMAVSNLESGNSYTLDADIDGTTVERIYFPKGGWVDFYSCDLDDDLTGDCLDEEGRTWTFDGESSWGPSSWVEEDENEEEEDEEEDGGTWSPELEIDDDGGKI